MGFSEALPGAFRNVNFADQVTGRIYLRIAAGTVLRDPVAFQEAVRIRHAGGPEGVAPRALEDIVPKTITPCIWRRCRKARRQRAANGEPRDPASLLPEAWQPSQHANS